MDQTKNKSIGNKRKFALAAEKRYPSRGGVQGLKRGLEKTHGGRTLKKKEHRLVQKKDSPERDTQWPKLRGESGGRTAGDAQGFGEKCR